MKPAPVIEQESSFQADPVVPGLGNIVWQEVEKKAGEYHIPLAVVKTAPCSSLPRTGAATSRGLTACARKRKWTSCSTKSWGKFPTGKNSFAQKDPVKTAGPMQVSVDSPGNT